MDIINYLGVQWGILDRNLYLEFKQLMINFLTSRNVEANINALDLVAQLKKDKKMAFGKMNFAVLANAGEILVIEKDLNQELVGQVQKYLDDESLFIFLDIGGTDLKFGYSQYGVTDLIRIIRHPMAPMLMLNDPHRKEIDPFDLLNRSLNLIKTAMPDDFVSADLYISGQMGSWLLTDMSNNPVSNIISWQDKRATKDFQLLSPDDFNSFYGDNWVFKNGGEFREGLPSISIHEVLKENIFPTEVRFHSLISWIAASLVVKPTNIMNSTDAASCGFYDVFLEKLMIDSLDLNNCHIIFPEVTNKILQIGLSPDGRISVFTPVGDQQASLFGSGLNEQNTVINIGTGGQISKTYLNGTIGKNQVRPYFHQNRILTKTHLPSGRAITSFLSFILDKELNSNDFIWMNRCALDYETDNHIDVLQFEKEIVRLRGIDISWSKEEFASIVIRSIVREYLSALSNFELNKNQEIIFAGGVGQKLTSISKLIENQIASSVKISSSVETTVSGLHRLSLNNVAKF